MKRVTSREFQKSFAEISARLEEGDTIEVTKRGRPLGRFSKIPARRIKMPNFLVELRRHTYSKELGNQLLKEFSDSLS